MYWEKNCVSREFQLQEQFAFKIKKYIFLEQMEAKRVFWKQICTIEVDRNSSEKRNMKNDWNSKLSNDLCLKKKK